MTTAWLLIIYYTSSVTGITMQNFDTESECKIIAEKVTAEITSAIVKTQCVELNKK